MVEHTLVSIITPIYNQANYISETIESVLSQDYDNLEYIVIDDGSTDNTREILSKYSSRIKWWTHKNVGESATVNEGINHARGEIICVVSSDDPLLPNIVKEMVRVFKERPSIIVAYPDWRMIDADGKVIDTIITFDYDYFKMLRWHHCMPGPGTFFKKDMFLSLGGRDTKFRYIGDYDFWLRAGLHGQFTRVPKILANYRWYMEGASSAAKGARMAEEHILLINKIYSQPSLTPDLLQIKNEAYSSAYYIAGVVCGDNIALKKKYFLSAIKYAPLKYFGEYRNRLKVILRVFFPTLIPKLKYFVKHVLTKQDCARCL